MRLGQILIEGRLVTHEDIQKALAWQMAEEVFACFTWDSFTDTFYRGEPPLDIFDDEDREYRVALNPGSLCEEAERHGDDGGESSRFSRRPRVAFSSQHTGSPPPRSHRSRERPGLWRIVIEGPPLPAEAPGSCSRNAGP